MDAFMDPFLLTLATTSVLRGLGAGIITGVELITLPARRRMGVVRYAQFARAHYKGQGVRAYAGITVLGALLTIALSASAFLFSKPAAQTWAIVLSLLATFLAFVGTAQAFPAMRQLWQSSDGDEILLASQLDRFARWGVFSATWHVVAFVALIVALVAPR